MNNLAFLLPAIMGLIAVSALTPWQLFQSLCPYVSAQSSQCHGIGTQQQQQPFTQQQQQPFTQQQQQPFTQQQQQPFTQQQQQPFTQQQQQPFTQQQQPSTTIIPTTPPQ
jgi:hypothetical protein